MVVHGPKYYGCTIFTQYSHDGAWAGRVLIADHHVAAARIRRQHDVLWRWRRRRVRPGARAAVAAAVSVVAAAAGRPRWERVGVRTRVWHLYDLGRWRRRWRWRRLVLLRFCWRRRRFLHLVLRPRRLELLFLVRLHDLDLLDDVAGLATELVGELVGVEGTRHYHPALLLVVLDVVDDELTLVSDPVEHFRDLGVAAAASQVYLDDDGRHLHCTAPWLTTTLAESCHLIFLLIRRRLANQKMAEEARKRKSAY